MATGHVCMAMSLDGFVARKDHSIDWLNMDFGDVGDMGIGAFFASVDAMVMGRGSFETMLRIGEWPYAFPVVVLSRSMAEDDIPEGYKDKVYLSSASPEEIMTELTSLGHQRIYVDGGKIVQSFIKAGLIEDMILTTMPILIGDGLRIFGGLEQDIPVELVSSTTHSFGVVQNTYRIPTK